MQTNILAFTTKYTNKFQTPLFTATIAGSKCIFIGDSEFVGFVYKNNRKLDSDFFSMLAFSRVATGFSWKKVVEIWNDRKSLDHGFQLVRKYVFARDELRKTVDHAQDILTGHLDRLPARFDGAGETMSIGMKEFVTNLIFTAAVGPMLSPTLGTDEVAETFRVFERSVPGLFANYPSFMVRDGIEAREKLLGHILKPEFAKHASPFVREHRAESKYDADATNRSHVGILFGTASNSMQAAFWALYHVLADPEARMTIQQEIDSIEGDDENLSLEQLDKLERLHSVFQETLRMYFAQFKPTMVMEDMVVDWKGQKYLLEKGTRIMSYAQVLHYDSDVFENADTFVWDRFLSDPCGSPAVFRNRRNGKVLTNPLMCFGGGKHMCPGRRFVSYEFKSMMVNLFRRFDLSLADGSEYPGVNRMFDGFGVAQPAGDVVLQVRLR